MLFPLKNHLLVATNITYNLGWGGERLNPAIYAGYKHNVCKCLY